MKYSFMLQFIWVCGGEGCSDMFIDTMYIGLADCFVFKIFILCVCVGGGVSGAGVIKTIFFQSMISKLDYFLEVISMFLWSFCKVKA